MNPAIFAFDLLERLFTDKKEYEAKKKARLVEELLLFGCELTNLDQKQEALVMFESVAEMHGVNLLVIFGFAGLTFARRAKYLNYKYAIQFLNYALTNPELSKIDRAILEESLEYSLALFG